MAVVSYTTVSKMQLTISLVASRTSTSSADLSEFAGRAETEINARLAKQYTLPFTDQIPILETLATEIAAQKYLEQRVFTNERRNDSDWPDAFDHAWDTLDKITAGEIPLITNSGGIIATRTDVAEVWSNTKDYHPTMTEDTPGRQVIDVDKIDDLRDERDQS